jgi:IS6 family transposase
MEKSSNIFKWKHFESEIILLTVRWYLQYRFSYRDLVEIMSERGISISHTTIMRWVHEYSPEIAKKVHPHLKSVNDSWRVDETYIKVKGHWTYLYWAVDSTGKTIDFMLSEKRNANFTKRLALEIFRLARRCVSALIKQHHSVNGRPLFSRNRPIYQTGKSASYTDRGPIRG